MKWLTNSLLGRTALLFTALLIISQLIWIAIGGYFFVRPFKIEYARELMYSLTMARRIVETVPASTWTTGAKHITLADGLTIYGTKPSAAPDVKVPPEDLEKYLQSIAGKDVYMMEASSGDTSVLWIRFVIDGREYWLSMAHGRHVLTPSIPMLMWLAITVISSLIGAYLVVGYLNGRLQALITGVRAIGRGENPGLLKEDGPDEIRELSRGFNQMYEGLNKIESDRRLMIAGISHDLRTPLARLRMGLELNTATIKSAHLRGMEEDIEQIDSILTQFLDFARDEQEEPRELCDINDIVNEVCSRYRLSGSVIQTSLSKLPPALLRPHAVKRLLTNLLTNAVEYGKKGIEVETRRDGNSIVLTVYDRGPGTLTSNSKDLLRPFARGDESRNHARSGLGLTVAERIALSHMGSLELVNRKGGGLAVVVRLIAYV